MRTPPGNWRRSLFTQASAAFVGRFGDTCLRRIVPLYSPRYVSPEMLICDG